MLFLIAHSICQALENEVLLITLILASVYDLHLSLVVGFGLRRDMDYVNLFLILLLL